MTGGQSVTYNAITYSTGQTFRGIKDIKTFTYSGLGTQEVNEVHELQGGGIEYLIDSNDFPVYSDITLLKGMDIEFTLNDAEKVVNEVTQIKGFALELIDYPFFSFEITEIRL